MEKEALNCSVCLTTWDHGRHQPVSLPACGHSFCRHCLIKLHSIKGNIECPICRRRHVGAEPKDLPTNFALLNCVGPDPDVQFADWARASGLTQATIERLESEDLNTSMALKLLDETDINQLGLTIGQRRILMAIVKKLQEPEVGSHTQEPSPASKKEQPSNTNQELKKMKDTQETNDGPKKDTQETNDGPKKNISTKVIVGAALGGLGLVAAAPLVLTGIGFTSAGIAGGSLAASMMSSAAVASGGSIAAGSTVALLQSAGAVGIPLAANAVIAAGGAVVGAGAGAAAGVIGGNKENDKDDGKRNETGDKKV